jgi:hypothetical protein
MIISLLGKMGSGKDTVGKIVQYLLCHSVGDVTAVEAVTNPEHDWWLEEQSEWEIKKFAGKLKTIASIIAGVPEEQFEYQKFKQKQMPKDWGMTYREFLQKLGTEAMRDGLHPNVWVNALFSDYIPYSVRGSSYEQIETNWVITDVRFPNEVEAIVKRGGITIRVVRPDMHSLQSMIPAHVSETALDDIMVHYEIVNDGTLEDLVERVKEILTKEKVI